MSGTAGATDLEEPVPTAANQAPMTRQIIGNFETMTPEQLQETALKFKGSHQGQLAQQMLARKRIMSADPAQQPPAPVSYGMGGTLQQKGGVHFPERSISPSGLLHTAGPGRTDNLNIHPHADSYVIPADVVSGLGEGNSLAGAKALDMAMSTGPHGIPMPAAGRHGMGIPKAPRPPTAGGFGMASGGEPPVRVPIVAAGGEYVLSPEQCRAIGGGDIKRGHRILDRLCLHIRAQTIKELRGLKPPVKS